MLENFKEGFSEEYRIMLTSEKLHIFCELEWPALGVSWPLEGTLDLPTVRAVYQIVTNPRISRPSSVHRHMAADRYYSAPLGPVWHK